jgi:hypothetical protein
MKAVRSIEWTDFLTDARTLIFSRAWAWLQARFVSVIRQLIDRN